MLHCITYLRCQLAPSGDQTSIWGLFNVPTVYFPFAFLFIELLMGGAEGLMRGLTGVAVGHMWFWGVYQSRALLNASKAPAWVNYVVARGPLPSLGGTGVHVITPRAKPQPKKGPTTWTGGHKWGSGNKLGGGKTSSVSQNP
jgi:Derlin-2/3